MCAEILFIYLSNQMAEKNAFIKLPISLWTKSSCRSPQKSSGCIHKHGRLYKMPVLRQRQTGPLPPFQTESAQAAQVRDEALTCPAGCHPRTLAQTIVSLVWELKGLWEKTGDPRSRVSTGEQASGTDPSLPVDGRRYRQTQESQVSRILESCLEFQEADVAPPRW